MSDTATGIAFLAIAAGGAYMLSKYNSGKANVTQRPTGARESRAENASEGQIDAATVLEATAPTLNGARGGGRMLERVHTTRLANTWRSSELPALNMRRDNGAELDEMLARVQTITKGVYESTENKLHHLLAEDRPRPMTQGKIRNKFQITNFKQIAVK